MNLILFGPPAAGKGTQADNLVKKFNLVKVSTGDLLRNEIQKKSNLSIEIKTNIDKGILVSDNIINYLIENILSKQEYHNRLIFDGYPRNLNQIENLNTLLHKYNQKISCVLNLEIDKEIIIKRVLGRKICTKCGLIFNKYFKPANISTHKCDSKFLDKRSDDNEKTILKRIDTYLEKRISVLNYYKDQKLLHQINGMREIDQIFQEIQSIIASLEA